MVLEQSILGSAFICDCTRSEFVLAARQVRINDCEHYLFLIDATMAPIIEQCNRC